MQGFNVNLAFKNGIKPVFTLIVIGLLVWISPVHPLDPWNLLNIKKISLLIFVLVSIHAFGSLMTGLLGARMGAIFTGLFGGLVSSTATTASLARESTLKNGHDPSSAALVFLSATIAMLLEAVVFVMIGATEGFNLSVLYIFVIPILTTAAMIFYYSRKVVDKSSHSETVPFLILPIIKLSAFIVLVLLLSKFLQNFFGQYGLLVLTFLVSLFEIHGSVIANVQLHESGTVDVTFLSSLLAVSIAASCTSKLFLITILGSNMLKTITYKCTLFLFISIFSGWMLSLSFS